MANDDQNSGAGKLVELAEKNGAPRATVKDGTVFVFKRTAMEEILRNNQVKDTVVIFVKRSDLMN